MSDIPKGIEPLASTGVELEIEGKKIVLRRLGLSDLFAAARVFRAIMLNGGADLASRLIRMDFSDANLVNTVVILGMSHAEEDILGWIANVAGVSYEEMRDPNKFPLHIAVDLVGAMLRHPDYTLFFEKAMDARGEIERMISIMTGKTNSDASSI